MPGKSRRVRPQMIQAGSNSGWTAYRASPEPLPGPFSEGKAPLGRYCPNRRGRGKYDPSRAGGGGVPGRPGCGHGDRPVPPGFAGVSVWRPAFVACASSAGSGDCSICGPGNNDGRSRTPGHSRSPGKTVDAVVLHGSPWRRFRRAGTTATEQGKRDLIYRGWSVRFFGPVQKARSGADGRGCPIPAPAYRSRSADDCSIPHYRRPAQCRSVDSALSVHRPLTPDGCLHGPLEPWSGPRTAPWAARPAR